MTLDQVTSAPGAIRPTRETTPSQAQHEGDRPETVDDAAGLTAEHQLVRKLTGLAAVDSEIERVIAEVQQHRLPLLTALVERLSAAGRPSPSISAARALDLLWMLSSFEAFDHTPS